MFHVRILFFIIFIIFMILVGEMFLIIWVRVSWFPRCIIDGFIYRIGGSRGARRVFVYALGASVICWPMLLLPVSPSTP